MNPAVRSSNDALEILIGCARGEPATTQTGWFALSFEAAGWDLLGTKNEDDVEIEFGSDVTACQLDEILKRRGSGPWLLRASRWLEQGELTGREWSDPQTKLPLPVANTAPEDRTMADRTTAGRDRQSQPSVWLLINPSPDERHDLDSDSVVWRTNRFLRIVEPVQEEVPQRHFVVSGPIARRV